MNYKTYFAFLWFILPSAHTFSEADLRPKPKPRITSENQILRGERKEDYAAKMSLEQVYGITDNNYEKFSQLNEKTPNYYRNLIENEHYAWFQPFGMRDSKIYQQGQWIYPYLVEGLTETETWDKNVLYPPKMIDAGAIVVDYSDVKVRLLHHVSRLYIQKNYEEFFNRSNFFYTYSDAEREVNSIVSSKNIIEIKKLQKTLINDYCIEFKASQYCKSI